MFLTCMNKHDIYDGHLVGKYRVTFCRCSAVASYGPPSPTYHAVNVCVANESNTFKHQTVPVAHLSRSISNYSLIPNFLIFARCMLAARTRPALRRPESPSWSAMSRAPGSSLCASARSPPNPLRSNSWGVNTPLTIGANVLFVTPGQAKPPFFMRLAPGPEETKVRSRFALSPKHFCSHDGFKRQYNEKHEHTNEPGKG